MNNKVRGLGLERKMAQWEKEKSRNGFKVVKHYPGRVLNFSKSHKFGDPKTQETTLTYNQGTDDTKSDHSTKSKYTRAKTV